MAKKTPPAEEAESEEAGVRKAPAGHDARVEAALEAAIKDVGDGPRKHRGFSFGPKHAGFGHDLRLAPIIQKFGDSMGVKADAKGFPKLLDLLDLWKPSNPAWALAKSLLVIAINSLANRMAHAGVTELEDDDFLTKVDGV